MKSTGIHDHPRFRMGLASALLASTALAGLPAHAQQASSSSTVAEVIVTAQKRAENIQKVPQSIQAIDSRKIDQLNITQFGDYVKYMPSVSFQPQGGPNTSSIYMRGVSSGDNANHSGPQPSVGTYLDEQPVTTIGGTLDIHIYDVARIEVLPGPQGTLYGASSEAGTLRIITNQPSTAKFSAGYNLEGNTVDHGSQGYVLEGFVNVPVTSNAAIRLVGWDEHDAGFIDNVLGSRTFATSGVTFDNAPLVKKDFNAVDTVGGRAALKIDLDNNWTITPTVIGQDQRANGVFGYEPGVGDLQVQRFQPDTDHDRWVQAALTVTGKLAKYDLTYSGGYFARDVDTKQDYTDYSIFYDALYGYGNYWVDAAHNPLATPLQEIIGKDHFTKESHELRLASPASDRFRFIAGLFYERQTHAILQDYVIQGFAPDLSVPGWPGTIWLTQQLRTDRDQAAFGEVSFDVTDKFTVTGGVRGYHYQNSLLGFYGFSENFDNFLGSNTGMGQTGQNCKPGLTYAQTPCVNLNKTVAASGETHKINATYKFDDQRLVYFTYSTGFRPGGVNRNGNLPPYAADYLSNYEVGWKTSWFDRRMTFNGAIYYENWKNFQFSFLGPNALTVIENAPSADIKGIETSLDWRATEQLTVSAGANYTDASLSANFCGTDQSTGQIIPTCATSAAEAPKGQQLPYTPKFKSNLTLRYTFDAMGWDGFLQGSALYQTKNYAALRPGDTAELGVMPGYASADISAGGSRNNVSLELFAKNLFDTRGQQNRYTACAPTTCGASVPGIPSGVYVVPIQPLTVGLRVGQKF